MKKIALSIVTWNHAAVIDECLSSLRSVLREQDEVYVLDNASTDDTVTRIQKYPFVKCITLKKNIGFAGGHNYIIKELNLSHYEYIVILNPDLVLQSLCLLKLEQFLNHHPKVSIAQPKILLYSSNHLNTIGNTLHFLGYSYCEHHNKPDQPLLQPTKVTIASGAALMIRSTFIQQYGLFDELFFAYHEDTDLSIRAWQVGYEIYCVPEAIVWHKHEFSKGYWKWFYLERNRWLLLLKNFPVYYLFVLLPILLSNEIWMLIGSIINGWFIMKLKSYWSIIHQLPTVYHYRKQYQQQLQNTQRLFPFLTWHLSIPEASSLLRICTKILNLFYFISWFIIRLLLRIKNS